MRQINGTEQAKTLYAKLGYPSVKYYRWIVQIQQIIYCPVMVQDIEIVHTIWCNNIADLKWKTTRKKPTQLAGDIVKIPKEIVKLHKEVFITEDIFFVNGISFLIVPSRNITFTAVSHL